MNGGLPLFFAILSARGVCQELEPHWAEALGVSSDEAMAQALPTLACWSRGEGGVDALSEAIEHVNGGHVAHCRVSVAGRSIESLDLSLVPVTSATGVLERIIVSAADTGRDARAHASLLAAQRQLAVGNLAGGMAHGLNNLLASTLMAAGILHDKMTAPDDRHLIETIEGNTRRAAALTRQVLDLRSASETAWTRIQPRQLLREMITLLRESFPRSLGLDYHVSGELWCVQGNANQLQQVLLALCQNAKEAMPRSGILELSAQNVALEGTAPKGQAESSTRKVVLVRVRDTGCGIEPADLAQLAEPFFTTKPGHVGLGLTSVASIVNRHCGVLSIDSEVGRGSTFQIQLPAMVEVDAAPESDDSNDLAGSGELVLIVDGDESVRESTRALLESQGFQTTMAASAEEANRRFLRRRSEIALVVTDASDLLTRQGDMIRAMHALEPDLPILATSRLGQTTRRDALLAQGVTQVLPRPCGEDMLVRSIVRALRVEDLE